MSKVVRLVWSGLAVLIGLRLLAWLFEPLFGMLVALLVLALLVGVVCTSGQTWR